MFSIEVEVKSKKWLKYINIEKFITTTAIKICCLLPLNDFKKTNFVLSFSLSSNIQIKRINHLYRNKNHPTDVLSFSNLDEEVIRKKGLKYALNGQSIFLLGDLIFGLEYIEKHCQDHNVDFNDHLTHLILHGILHIIGYDHEIGNEQAKIMENLEIKILKKLNIKNPYNR